MVDKGPPADGTADSSAYLDHGDASDRDTAQKLRRVGAAWGGQQPGQLRRRRPCRGLATAATRCTAQGGWCRASSPERS
jgi:hypothetical protein